MCLKNVIHPIDFTRASSTRRALPNCAPTHPQPLSPTPSHSYSLPVTLTHSHSLPPIFQEKQPTPTQFSGKTTHSHPFFDKIVPLPAISDGKRPTLTQVQRKQPNSTHVSTNLIHSGSLPVIFQQKRPTLTILTLFSTDPPQKQLVFTSFPTITDFPSLLPLMY